MATKTDLIVKRSAENPVRKCKSCHQSTETDAKGWDTKKKEKKKEKKWQRAIYHLKYFSF